MKKQQSLSNLLVRVKWTILEKLEFRRFNLQIWQDGSGI